MAELMTILTPALILIVTIFQTRALKQIHVLVNDRLDKALKEINWLKKRLSNEKEDEGKR
jgi:hypothetical protein